MYNTTTISTTKDNPVEGSMYFNTNNQNLYVYTNGNWIEVIYDVFDDINIKRKNKMINIQNRV
jgi:hypothetical protein